MRWPLGMCRVLGKTTATYRWFAVFYLFVMFFIIPGVVMGKSLILTSSKLEHCWIIFVYYLFLIELIIDFKIILGLSIAGLEVLFGILTPIASVAMIVLAINILQAQKPEWLPKKLRSWVFLPFWMHSLDPLDKVKLYIFSFCLNMPNI